MYNANVTGLSTKPCGTPKFKYEEEFMKKFTNKMKMNKLEAISYLQHALLSIGK